MGLELREAPPRGRPSGVVAREPFQWGVRHLAVPDPEERSSVPQQVALPRVRVLRCLLYEFRDTLPAGLIRWSTSTTISAGLGTDYREISHASMN